MATAGLVLSPAVRAGAGMPMTGAHVRGAIEHLFFDCQHAKVIWSTVQVATGLTPPKSVTHMLRNWLQNFNAQEAFTILTGAAALC